MNFHGARRKPEDPVINITSLVDVLFILLLFFILSTTWVTAPGIKVNLPKTESREPSKEKRELTVVVSKDGKLYVETRQVSVDQLAKLLADKAKKGETDAPVVIQADEATMHGKVVEVMDLAKTAGFNKLAIATEQKQKK